jgi:hypothetical protein
MHGAGASNQWPDEGENSRPDFSGPAVTEATRSNFIMQDAGIVSPHVANLSRAEPDGANLVHARLTALKHGTPRNQDGASMVGPWRLEAARNLPANLRVTPSEPKPNRGHPQSPPQRHIPDHTPKPAQLSPPRQRRNGTRTRTAITLHTEPAPDPNLTPKTSVELTVCGMGVWA